MFPLRIATRIATRAPARIDFGGGWTDVPPYCDEAGGFVCNLAIDRYASVEGGLAEAPGPEGSGDLIGDARLIAAAIRRFGPREAAIVLTNDFPVGAGLGGSSAASAAILGALAALRGESPSLDRIAEDGRVIEVEDLGVAGGRQDHYASVYGGALALTFTTGVEVRRIPVPEATMAALERRLLLLYTGESRISGDTITAVLGAYQARVRRVVDSLKRMEQLARAMAAALERGDVDELGSLVGEHWVHQRALHQSIPTHRIDEIIARAEEAGALGAKALGASGGGTVLVIARDDNVEAVTRAIEPLGTLLPFGVDREGLKRLA